MDYKNISILIPAYNPTKDLIPLVEELLEKNFNVIVVNDGSKKEANEIFSKLNTNIVFLEHPKNMGKGQALKTGFEYILKNLPCKGVITADADGQHLLSDIINIANELEANTSDLILGSRKLDNATPFKSKFGNSLTRITFKIATGTHVYDTQTGLRGIPYNYLKDFLSIEGQRYEYEINMLIYCAKNKIQMKEITITTVYIDDNKASSFNIVKDSIKIYKCLFKNSNLLQSLLFGISALLSFLIDLVLVLLLHKITEPIFDANIALLFSVIGARIVSSLFNFFVNRKVVFQSKSNIYKALVKYYTLVVIILFANYLLLNLLTLKLDINLTLSKILVEILLFTTNYLISRFMIFKRII